MKARQFEALATLSGIGEGTARRGALRDHLCGGLTLAECARRHRLHHSTIQGGRDKMIAKHAQLPQELETVKTARGNGKPLAKGIGGAPTHKGDAS